MTVTAEPLRRRPRRGRRAATSARPTRSRSPSRAARGLARVRARHRGRAHRRRRSSSRPPGSRSRATCPQGSGLSSSAALETALCLALLGVAGADEPDRVELAKLCSRVENDWVGAETGLLDQLASLLGEEGHALRIDFATLALEPVPLDLGGWQLVTVDSGAAHAHAEAATTSAARECGAAAEALGVEHAERRDPRRPSGCAARGAGAPATC